MPLNVVGLVSGGKDSLFSLAHCCQNGHKLVALANLYPNSTTTADSRHEDGEGSDLDSFMYQTVGHSVVPLYGEALGVPLYRKGITGTAVQNGRYYETGPITEATDEIEDMYALIKEIVERHPEINALSAGAILSTYQRTRVESVAVRLGLVPLAYLWQYPALPPPTSREDSLTGLLDDMESSGCDARIIKIASGGIHTNMSFSDVTDSHIRAKLVSGMTPFFIDAGQEFWLRGAVLGEGGEYETLALDGPGLLWKKRIRIDSHEAYEAGGGAVYVRFGKASLVERTADQNVSVPIPVLLDERFAFVQSKITSSSNIQKFPDNLAPALVPDSAPIDQLDMSSSWNRSSKTVQISNLTSPGPTAAEQLDRVITALPSVLSNVARLYNMNESSLGAETLVSVTLLLRAMEDFASVNQVYTTKLWPLGLSNPPARVTVAASLPRTARVSISLIYHVADDESVPRKGLHVQSRSYWAPANIGPYSQAICVPVFGVSPVEVVHLAGQIPLVPSTMTMLEAPFIEQAVLALQHLWRVAQERGVDQWAGSGVAFLAHPSTSAQDDIVMLQHAREAARIWRLSHQIDEKGYDIHNEHLSTKNGANEVEGEEENDDEDIDIWDLQQRYRGFGTVPQTMTVGEHLHKLPRVKIDAEAGEGAGLFAKQPSEVPCFIAAQVLGLPRDAPIEWWSTGIAGLFRVTGAQTVKVSAIPTVTRHSWTLSGIAIEENSSDELDDTKPRSTDSDQGSAMSSQQKSSFFVTLVIDATIENDWIHLLPHALADLTPYLLQNPETHGSFAWELATAHCFLNLSCPMAVTAQENFQLLQRSCMVPCNHVWSTHGSKSSSSMMPRTGGLTGSEVERTVKEGTAGTAEEGDEEVKEVAAALVMRIDAVSKKSA